MDLTPELAEVYGALLGDGGLSKYFANYDKRFRYELAFTGANDEYEYYSSFLQPVFHKYFGTKRKPFIRKDNSARYHIKNKRIFEYFFNLGFPVGEKQNNVFIPKIISKDKELLRSCLRGVWDTDGSIYLRYSKRYSGHARHYSNLLVLQMKLFSLNLIQDIKEGLTRFSISSNNITKAENQYVFRITSQNEILKFLNEIGFRTKHHLTRIVRFSKMSN